MFLRRRLNLFPSGGDLFTTRRLSVELLNAVVDRQEAEITRLLTRDIEREKEMVVLRERNSKWETPTSGTGDLPEDLPFHLIGNRTQVHRNDLFGDCDKKVFGVNLLDYIQSCIESFRLNLSAPQLIPAWC